MLILYSVSSLYYLQHWDAQNLFFSISYILYFIFCLLNTILLFVSICLAPFSNDIFQF